LERKLFTQIKVAQLGGAVSEKSCYHHGEASLYGAIVNMAQNYMGSNNINLLEPNGQFGTRLQGGDDAASERYIFTQLNKITRLIYPLEDDPILDYQDDDGTQVEPVFYVPIIPMQLVNGSKGIGTGFSTDIPNYNPLVIIDYVVSKLNDDSTNPSSLLVPYYQGFKGTITPISESKFLVKGVYQILSDKQVRVTELPVGFWTEDFKNHLEELIELKPAPAAAATEDTDKKGKAKAKKVINQVKDYIDMSTDTTVDFTITFSAGVIAALKDDIIDKNGCSALEKLLKLYTTRSTTNMHVFDENEKLIKFDKPEELVEKFMRVRLDYYIKRKAYQVLALEKELKLLSNKARFISELLDDTLDLRKKKTAEVSALLKSRKYDIIQEDTDYKYLVRLPMDSVTEENIAKIMKERDSTASELLVLKGMTEKQLWLNELALLRAEYVKMITTVVDAKPANLAEAKEKVKAKQRVPKKK
jgi:DNA topoisomerase-2